MLTYRALCQYQTLPDRWIIKGLNNHQKSATTSTLLIDAQHLYPITCICLSPLALSDYDKLCAHSLHVDPPLTTAIMKLLDC